MLCSRVSQSAIRPIKPPNCQPLSTHSTQHSNTTPNTNYLSTHHSTHQANRLLQATSSPTLKSINSPPSLPTHSSIHFTLMNALTHPLPNPAARVKIINSGEDGQTSL